MKTISEYPYEYHCDDTDENGNYPGEAEYELDAFINSLEGRLAGFTTEELVLEVNDRTMRALKELTEANERLARHLGLEKAVF